MPTRAALALLVLAALAVAMPVSPAAGQAHPTFYKSDYEDKFRQLEEILPTPNEQRTASGAPGHAYWQQKVDYEIDVTIDEATRRLTGSERITYHNRSPDRLDYLWVQIDPNIFAPDSEAVRIENAPDLDRPSPRTIKRLIRRREFDGSADITRVEAADGTPLPHVVNGTMMRIDLEEALAPGATFVFEIDWTYVVNRSDEVGGRTGAEWFEDDGNWLFEMAQWFPRMAQYTDARGWHNKQFLGRGEFSLEFGDYLVRITMPADHVVASTGVLQNPEEVLSPVQRERLREAETATTPMFIVTPEEAVANQAEGTDETRTWVYRAENVRDFAWASSRKFIWDAMLHEQGGSPVWCMSYYPIEGEPLWSRYSTHAIMHTIDVYSRYTFDYPYPVAISVNGPVGGMEYPMICFNGPRPEEDGTYSKRTKYGLIGVIIHEVGHNYFPMIVNSDERQWTWMDEGLNTFVQFLAQEEWEDEYPQRRGDAEAIVPYMTSENRVPIMTNSESLLQFGANAYALPATALNVLRETVMGRELFDHAFKTYARRWKFRNPQPADLFRTMEDASGVDLDWFWRAWFYTTDHVDVAVENVRVHRMNPTDPYEKSAVAKAERDAEGEAISRVRNRDLPKRTDRFPELLDFYNEYDELDVDPNDERSLERLMNRLEDDEADWMGLTHLHFTVADFRNLGGIPTPLPLELEYADGTVERRMIPAQIWQKGDDVVSKLFISDQPIVRITYDPDRETADANRADNAWPREPVVTRFDVFKRSQDPNPMQLLEGKRPEDWDDEEAGGDRGP